VPPRSLSTRGSGALRRRRLGRAGSTFGDHQNQRSWVGGRGRSAAIGPRGRRGQAWFRCQRNRTGRSARLIRWKARGR